MALEKRLSDVEQSIKVIAQYVKEQNEKIENELNALKGTEGFYDPRPEIEQLKVAVESLRSTGGTELPVGERVRKSIHALRTEFDVFRNEAAPKLQYLDKKTDKLRETVETVSLADIEDLKRYVERMDKKIHETLALKEELDDIEETLTKMKVIANRLKDFDVASYREEFDRHMADMFGKFEETEMQDIRELAKHMKEVKESAEEEAISRISTEKRLADIEAKLAQIKSVETKDISQLNAMLEHLQGIEIEEMKSIAATIKEAKEALEEESVNRLSAEKRLAAMEEKVNKVNEIAGHIENVEGLDIQKLSSRINDIESNMKMNTVRLLTQQLNEFAKSMDRRLPNIVSREEYARQIADLNQRMRTIEAPDLSPLGARVERLEKKIEEVAAMMRQMYNRVPIVVE